MKIEFKKAYTISFQGLNVGQFFTIPSGKSVYIKTSEKYETVSGNCIRFGETVVCERLDRQTSVEPKEFKLVEI